MNNHSPLQSELQANIEDLRTEYLETGVGDSRDKLRSIMRFLSRQELAKILAYESIFTRTRGVCGSILDLGVFFGGGLFTYANLRATLEPYNYQCRVIGFDTFEGDVGQTDFDYKHGVVDRNKFTYKAEVFEDLQKAINIFDRDRPLGHIPMIELVKGDISETGKAYVQKHPELLVRILHLSVNLLKPTTDAISYFYPRIPRGGAVVVHGLNFTTGATEAVIKEMSKFSSLPSIKTIDYYPNVTFFIKS